MVDAIMFSANPPGHTQDAINHLTRHPVVFWTVDFRIVVADDWKFPLAGYIHLSGDQVRFRAKIEAILHYNREHYAFETLKPEPWRAHFSKYAEDGKFSFVISEIVEFAHPTSDFEKLNGERVKHPPEGYVRVRHPEKSV